MTCALSKRQTLQQPGQLSTIRSHHLPLRLRPPKTILLQPFMPEAKTVAIPVEDLHHILLSVAETKQITGERVQVEQIANISSTDITKGMGLKQ